MRRVHTPEQIKSHKSSVAQGFIGFFCFLVGLLSLIRTCVVFNFLVRLKGEKRVYLLLPPAVWSPWWVCICLLSLRVPWTVLGSNYLERQRNEREHLTFKSLSACRPGGNDANTPAHKCMPVSSVYTQMELRSVCHVSEINTHRMRDSREPVSSEISHTSPSFTKKWQREPAPRPHQPGTYGEP